MRIHKSKISSLLLLATIFYSCDNDLVNEDYISSNNTKDAFGSLSSINNMSSFVPADSAVVTANEFIASSSILRDNIDINNYNLHTIYDGINSAIYVVNYQNGGFVIVGSSKCYYPILAFSESGFFDTTNIADEINNWVEETKKSINASYTLNDSTQAKMNSLWRDIKSSKFEISTNTRKSGRISSSAMNACFKRLDEYAMKYGNGWIFMPLIEAQSYFEQEGWGTTYQSLCYSAEFNHSSLETSIIGLKIDREETTVGPLLKTQWSQKYPFNKDCPEHFYAGCSTIAAAQIMFYYQFPQVSDFNWSDIPQDINSSSNQGDLSKYVRKQLNVRFLHTSFWGEDDYYAWTRPDDMEKGLKKMGFHVYVKDHYAENIESELLQRHRPVIMLGSSTNLSALPEPLCYIGDSHYWICDGYNRLTPKKLLYFTEWQPNGNGQYIEGWYSITSPGECIGTTYSFSHMNWGWRGNYDGWYTEPNPGEHNFKHSQKDFFLYPNK